MPLLSTVRLPAAGRILALTVVASALLAACGGDAGTGPTPGGPNPQKLDIVAAAGVALPGLAGKTLSLAPGDSARLSGIVSDSKGATQLATGINWSIGNATVAVVDGSGNVRAIANGTTSLVAKTSQFSDTLAVIVSSCGSVPTISLAVGQVVTYGSSQGGDLCADGGAAGGEYALVAYNADSAGSVSKPISTSLTISGSGITDVASNVESLAAASLSTSPSLGASLALGSAPNAPRRNVAFDLALRRTAARVFRPSVLAAARQAHARAASAPSARYSVTAAPLVVGQLITLNAGLEPCDTTKVGGIDRRIGRVVAITNRAIVVADTANPANGFTTAQYQAYGTAFDTLAYPVDVANFGDPQDVDKNGKSIIFFTRAVNAMTPRNAPYYVGGFFYERDLFDNRSGLAEDDGGCGASNFAEMFYMLVPDPDRSKAINGNARSVGFVDSVTVGTLGHEFQHLINASRRIYVNSADGWEQVWLNEGLSHIAEELVFYRAGGIASKQRLTASSIRASTATRDAFNIYAKGNFERYLSFVDAPEANSPYADDDELETRGATWQFLRYAADRLNGTDSQLWLKLVATTKLDGMRNLQTALGINAVTMGDWFRDWTVANYADGLVSGLSAPYGYRSWSFRDVVGGFQRGNGQPLYPTFPLLTRSLSAGFSQTAQVRGGGAAYFRFAVGPNKQAAIHTRGASAEQAMGGTVRLSVVRTK
jgi:hypothetical protein